LHLPGAILHGVIFKIRKEGKSGAIQGQLALEISTVNEAEILGIPLHRCCLTYANSFPALTNAGVEVF